MPQHSARRSLLEHVKAWRHCAALLPCKPENAQNPLSRRHLMQRRTCQEGSARHGRISSDLVLKGLN